ncbi:PqqD family protein [Propioniciclava sp.]|uniref:PqqD family protein n=1 Tax=Propioniciclava sp. TaxID=2038686 RepID=UPI002612893B|nr:PqqD family protein [Propioniciclava sp.]
MSGRLRRPVGVGVAESEGLVYLGLLPAGPIHCLDAAGSLIWSVAVREPRERLVDAVAEAAGVAPEVVRADVERFVAYLIEHGLLEEAA